MSVWRPKHGSVPNVTTISPECKDGAPTVPPPEQGARRESARQARFSNPFPKKKKTGKQKRRDHLESKDQTAKQYQGLSREQQDLEGCGLLDPATIATLVSPATTGAAIAGSTPNLAAAVAAVSAGVAQSPNVFSTQSGAGNSTPASQATNTPGSVSAGTARPASQSPGSSNPAASVGNGGAHSVPAQPTAAHLRRLERQAIRKARYKHLPKREGQTQLVFYATVGIDWRVLYYWALFSTLWMYILPDFDVLGDGSWMWIFAALKLVGLPFHGILKLVCRLAVSYVLGASPEIVNSAGACVFLALVEAILLCHFWMRDKTRIPLADYLLLRTMFDDQKSRRMSHTYTYLDKDRGDVGDSRLYQMGLGGDPKRYYDNRPGCSARQELEYDHPDMAVWGYVGAIAGRAVYHQLLLLSNEAVTQICANPRIMHLRSVDDTVREQIKMAVATLERVNIHRNDVFRGESTSAHLEALCFAFYKHQEHKNRHLPF